VEISFFIAAALFFQLLGVPSLQNKMENKFKNSPDFQVANGQAEESRQEILNFKFNPATVAVAPTPKNLKEPRLSAVSAVVIDPVTGNALFAKDKDAPHPLASTTKVMTAITAFEAYDLKDIITVSGKASYIDGTDMHLTYGETMTFKDLLYGMMLVSANDAAEALADYYDENHATKFVALMNENAKSFGLSKTKYVDPTGLDGGNESSAYELALIFREAVKNQNFVRIVNTQTYTSVSADGRKGHPLSTSNRLLKEQPGLYIGGKTGYNNEGNHNLVVEASYNGHKIIGVVFGCGSYDILFNDMRKIINWTFDNYTWED